MKRILFTIIFMMALFITFIKVEAKQLVILSGEAVLENMFFADNGGFKQNLTNRYDDQYIILENYMGGMGIEYWTAGDYMYTDLFTKLEQILNTEYISSVVFVWAHGEINSWFYDSEYKSKLRILLDTIQDALPARMNVVMSLYPIHPWRKFTEKAEKVRAAQIDVCQSWHKCRLLRVDDMVLHMDSDSPYNRFDYEEYAARLSTNVIKVNSGAILTYIPAIISGSISATR